MALYRVAGPDEKPVWAELVDGRLRAVDPPDRVAPLGESTVPEGSGGTDLGPLQAAEILAPARPTKIVCLGRNYRRHAEELGNAIPDEPLIFLKPPSAVVPTGASIELPAQSEDVHHEAELACVIGRRARRVSPREAAECIAGYTCANDVTARDIQRREGPFTRAKGFDTFCPVGPALRPADGFEPAEHRLTGRVDGETRQSSRLDDFIFPIPEALAFISDIMTLCVGDVVLTGTPAGVGSIEAGQTVEVAVDGIGTLSNPVVARDEA